MTQGRYIITAVVSPRKSTNSKLVAVQKRLTEAMNDGREEPSPPCKRWVVGSTPTGGSTGRQRSGRPPRIIKQIANAISLLKGSVSDPSDYIIKLFCTGKTPFGSEADGPYCQSQKEAILA
jgi:hypothetical protein